MSDQITDHFKRSEFACRCGCGFDDISIDLVILLETLRRRFGFPIQITSGCRCAKHNAAVGGSKDSAHLKGLAADIKIFNSHHRYLILREILFDDLFTRIEEAPNWIHVDIDGSKPQKVVFLKKGEWRV